MSKNKDEANTNASLISIIVPVHNEDANVRPLYKKLVENTDYLPNTFEFIFIDDGSADCSLLAMERLAREDKRVRVIEFARNFGKEAAISAGLHAASGEAAIMIDADLQHPPERIGDFIAAWEQGADVVVGVRRTSKSETRIKRMASSLFYQILQKIAHTQITPHATDFRLVDRKVMDVFARMTERNRITRGLIDWLGFRRAYVNFEAQERASGSASYTYRKLMTLAVQAFTNYSLVPLKLAGYLGIFILLTATPTGIIMYVERYVLNDPLGWQIRGTAMLAILLVVLVGVVLACLGLMSLYIANIHAEVNNRPLYVVRRHDKEIAESVPAMVLRERVRA